MLGVGDWPDIRRIPIWTKEKERIMNTWTTQTSAENTRYTDSISQHRPANGSARRLFHTYTMNPWNIAISPVWHSKMNLKYIRDAALFVVRSAAVR